MMEFSQAEFCWQEGAVIRMMVHMAQGVDDKPVLFPQRASCSDPQGLFEKDDDVPRIAEKRVDIPVGDRYCLFSSNPWGKLPNNAKDFRPFFSLTRGNENPTIGAKQWEEFAGAMTRKPKSEERAMKKCGVILIATMMAAGAMAATNVTSVNAVGFIRTTVPAGGWGLISLPFNRVDGGATLTVGDILPDAPLGVKAWFYRDGEWQAETRQSVTTPFPPHPEWVPGTNEFIRGDALFVNSPESAGDITLSVMGEVPDSRTAPTTTVYMAEGWTLVGFSYPADVALTNTALNAMGDTGDKIWWWDQEANSGAGDWVNATKQSVSDPPPPRLLWVPEDTVLRAGQGYFYNRVGSGFDWTQIQPYEDPTAQ